MRKEELEEVMREMEQRLEEEEERTNVYNAEKKKLQTSIQDLEEQLVLLIFYKMFLVCIYHKLQILSVMPLRRTLAFFPCKGVSYHASSICL